jgi:hypothetical protein
MKKILIFFLCATVSGVMFSQSMPIPSFVVELSNTINNDDLYANKTEGDVAIKTAYGTGIKKQGSDLVLSKNKLQRVAKTHHKFILKGSESAPRIDPNGIASKEGAFASTRWQRSECIIPSTQDTLIVLSHGGIEVSDRRKKPEDKTLQLSSYCGNNQKETLVSWKETDGQFLPSWIDGDNYHTYHDGDKEWEYHTDYHVAIAFKKTVEGSYQLSSISVRQISAGKVGVQELEYTWEKGEVLNNRFMILAISLLAKEVG